MASVGYARVSTRDQHPDARHDALAAAGCEKVFTDHASGALARRTGLDEALGYLRYGEILVVTKLDRLGRSVRHLQQIVDDLQGRDVGLRALSQGIDTTTPGGRLFFHVLAAIAEFEHDLIVERTVDGLAAARARGRRGGPKFKMNPTKIAAAATFHRPTSRPPTALNKKPSRPLSSHTSKSPDSPGRFTCPWCGGS